MHYCNIGLFSIAPNMVIDLPRLSEQKLSLLASLLHFIRSFVLIPAAHQGHIKVHQGHIKGHQGHKKGIKVI